MQTNTTYKIKADILEWENMFTLSKLLTSNTTLIEFQFKIIYTVYARDSYVSKFENTVSKI